MHDRMYQFSFLLCRPCCFSYFKTHEYVLYNNINFIEMYSNQKSIIIYYTIIHILASSAPPSTHVPDYPHVPDYRHVPDCIRGISPGSGVPFLLTALEEEQTLEGPVHHVPIYHHSFRLYKGNIFRQCLAALEDLEQTLEGCWCDPSSQRRWRKS